MAKQPRAPWDPPELSPPSPEAVARAAPLFAQLMGLAGPAMASRHSAPAALPAPPPRRYPLAARLLAQHPEGALADAAPSLPGGPRRLLGFVRKSVPKVQVVPQVLLEDVAHMALFDEGRAVQPGDGGEDAATMASFVIVFREELLGELQCRIEAQPDGGIRATFVAADAQTYATLTAETPRLRRQLQARGLASVDVAIEQG